jgi:FixJ family two-component response regulator
MRKTALVSVVEDDRYSRVSMRGLMKSLSYNVETFASAANFLACPRLIETTCLVADIHMPAIPDNFRYRLSGRGETRPRPK